MQLIVESEAALDIKRDMSDIEIEDINTEKVVNGDIEQLIEKSCNGNKENIDIISNDDKSKLVIDKEIEALPSLQIDVDIKIENAEETCEETIPKTYGKQKEESQSNGTDEKNRSTSPIIKEEIVEDSIIDDEEAIVEDKEVIGEDEETVLDDEEAIVENKEVIGEDEEAVLDDEEAIVEDKEVRGEDEEAIVKDKEVIGEDEEAILDDEEDLIIIKQENLDQIPDIAEKELVNVEPEIDDIKICEDLPVTKDNMDVIEKPSDTHTETATIPDVILDEPVPDEKLTEQANTVKNDGDSLECSENKDKPIESPENKEKEMEIEEPVCDSTEVTSSNNTRASSPIELKDDMDVEEILETEQSKEQVTTPQAKEKSSAPVNNNPICKLSNTLDILSDDEDESPKEESPKVEDLNEKQCINIEDDDDIMLIDDETTKTETPQPVDINKKEDVAIETEDKTDSETKEEKVEDTTDLFTKTEEKDQTPAEVINDENLQINVSEKQEDEKPENFSSELPLLPGNFLKSAKKNLSDMTREELEEFCILKIVESIVDRSNLSEIKNKLKTVAQGVDEYRKKVMMLTKQNRDLQVVLKSIQEEQKKSLPGTPITPLKITRSVGMQVFMEKTGARRKNLSQLQNPTNTRQGAKSSPGTNLRPQKPGLAPGSLPGTVHIPVPRLVPASPTMKSPSTIPMVTQITSVKPTTPLPNGVKNPSPAQKAGEKRQHNRIMSVTVDLTDDEPPTKVNNRTSPAPPVRVVPSQNLMANPRQPFPGAVSTPRKVYIPISGPPNQNVRPGQTIMLKTVPPPGLRPRGPAPQVVRPPTGPVRMNRVHPNRHPAPLPDAMKQYQPPNWKALPPAPDLKLSKVENGIVISWKIEGYLEDSYEEIASYQLYAYQETSTPPSTSLWKKIGDVKALPLPMACTLTQFMAGFKYFFAVRAVDIRSRLGPFSLPGSILLLNKL
ncbi:hypothetical protein PYW07_014045 [Mythimna separata]|uniref:Activating transcription factor 7-interacting protein Fn3 domain-containing protein n=1 Tax=Mythimna separata TaxID=271217 RepID=A0AAD8DPX1_MYTSE|nr:hypothetical protein PYW07_014045 [Mythimna separata]